MDPQPGSPRILIIIPAYNESASIARVVSDVRAAVPGARVAVVDDGSSDDTAGRARAAGATVLRLPFNLGVGSAMQTGFLAALEWGFDVAVQVDGDGQHPAGEIQQVIEPLIDGRAQVCIGTRYLDDRGYVTPAGRRAGQRYFSSLVRLLTGRRFTDTTSGFRAYDRKALAFLARNYARDYPEVNAIVALCHNQFQICEVPVTMQDRQAGVSHINRRRAIFYVFKVTLAALMSASQTRWR